MKRFRGYLWYLSGEAVALFDQNFPCDINRNVVNAIQLLEEYKEKNEDVIYDGEIDKSSEENSERRRGG